MAADKVPLKMKAVQVYEFNAPYVVTEVDDVPKPKPDQVLVQIKAGDCCHTDCMPLESPSHPVCL